MHQNILFIFTSLKSYNLVEKSRCKYGLLSINRRVKLYVGEEKPCKIMFGLFWKYENVFSHLSVYYTSFVISILNRIFTFSISFSNTRPETNLSQNNLKDNLDKQLCLQMSNTQRSPSPQRNPSDPGKKIYACSPKLTDANVV